MKLITFRKLSDEKYLSVDVNYLFLNDNNYKNFILALPFLLFWTLFLPILFIQLQRRKDGNFFNFFFYYKFYLFIIYYI
jgi:hypothetical protein